MWVSLFPEPLPVNTHIQGPEQALSGRTVLHTENRTGVHTHTYLCVYQGNRTGYRTGVLGQLERTVLVNNQMEKVGKSLFAKVKNPC